MKPIQPHIEVSCAIIERDGLVLAAQRGEVMNMPMKWEFPGGKIEPRENAATCIQREIREELGTEICILATLPPSEWRYPDFTITLYPFVCRLNGGILRLAEHRAVCWMSPEKLLTLDWAEADGPVLQAYFRYIEG